MTLYRYKLPGLEVKSLLVITVVASQLYLFLESLNRLTLRQIGGAFFGALFFVVLPWTRAIMDSGVSLVPEICTLFFLIVILSYRFSKSWGYLLVGILMILMVLLLSADIACTILAVASLLLLMEGLIDRESTSNRIAVYLGLFGICAIAGLGYSLYAQFISADSFWRSLGTLFLMSISFLGYLKIQGYWLQRSLFLFALFMVTASFFGTYYFPLFFTLSILYILGLLPRFWMKYPFVGGFIYCCWEAWAV